tara:strand:+ start:171 stop:542 length:372 start_codon:yes stop_codon:yes gene_type:complete
MKRRLKELCQLAELDFDEVLDLAHAKLTSEMLTGKGGSTWITDVGWERLSTAIVIPEIVPKHHIAQVIKPATNPRYVFGYIRELSKKVAILVPRKLHKRLTGKKITIEEITDANGTSFRLFRA